MVYFHCFRAPHLQQLQEADNPSWNLTREHFHPLQKNSKGNQFSFQSIKKTSQKFVCQGSPFWCNYFNLNQSIKFGIRRIVHGWLLKSCYRNRNFFQRFLHITLTLLCKYSILVDQVCTCQKLNCWSMTWLFWCKQGTPMFGCPCSDAVWKACELWTN